MFFVGYWPISHLTLSVMRVNPPAEEPLMILLIMFQSVSRLVEKFSSNTEVVSPGRTRQPVQPKFATACCDCQDAEVQQFHRPSFHKLSSFINLSVERCRHLTCGSAVKGEVQKTNV